MIDQESLKNWLSNFLKKRSLSWPNGNPLFSYYMTIDEYSLLDKIVKLFKPKTSINRLKHKIVSLFCYTVRRVVSPLLLWLMMGVAAALGNAPQLIEDLISSFCSDWR